ncbi:MAG: ATP-binding protein [Bacillota bacterium]|nr:ATP-binding protein [Bacillota bacterium]
MNFPYRLLRQDEIFGDDSLGLFNSYTPSCQITDFAVATGGSMNSEMKGKWFIATPAGYGDVYAVDEEGQLKKAYASTAGSIRPALEVIQGSDLQESILHSGSKAVSGYMEFDFGEYPQFAVSKALSNELSHELKKARLRKTGKSYNGHITEYQFKDRKFVQVEYMAKESYTLSNEKVYKDGDSVWIEVSPVKWIYDENSKLAICKYIIAGGVVFAADNYYDGNFENTSAFLFLQDMAQDLVASELHEMTEEERLEYEADIQRAEKRQNPYSLTFGEVSEEDIIRGAIESDVAVFIHGPSSEGKSARVKQIDPTCEILYLRNATPDSLNGRSVYNQATGEMIDIPPVWYRKLKEKCEAEPDTFHVIFFDEINNALPSIQGMAFNIVLDREVNGIWRLPSNARVVAAGNDMEDSLAANQIAAPFFNRFAHVYINTTTEKWLKWAREHNIHPAIYAYIACTKGRTLRSPYDGVKPNADPRKWEMASKMLYATGKPEMLRSLIGEEITDEFVKFCNQSLMSIEDVLSGNYSQRDIDDMNTAERYMTTVGLSQAKATDIPVVRDFVSKLGEEFRAVFDAFAVYADGSPDGITEIDKPEAE